MFSETQWTEDHQFPNTTRVRYTVKLSDMQIFLQEKKSGKQVLRRGYDVIVKGKKVLVVEDLTTTGGSVKQVVDCVREAGGQVVSVCVMVNRDPKNVNAESVGAPFAAADVLEAQAFDEADCPFCKEARPINTNIGHGKKYLESKK